jgi:hypothetical protein
VGLFSSQAIEKLKQIAETVLTKMTPGSDPQRTPQHAPISTGKLVRVDPDVGPLAGNSQVTLHGEGFTGATAVTFGGVNGTDLKTKTDTELTVTVPRHAAGKVDVVVVIDADRKITLRDGYTYEAPAIESINPTG